MNDIRLALREWRSERVTHIAAIISLALGLVMYAFYQGWSTRVATLQGQSVPPLGLSADVVVVEPDWLLRVTRPDFDLLWVRDHGSVKPNTKASVLLLSVNAVSPWGTVQALGYDPAHFHPLADAVVLQSGHWPTSGQAAIPQEWLQTTDLQVGDHVSVSVIQWPTSHMETRRLEISGAYTTSDPLLKGIWLDESDLRSLAGYPRGYNVLYLWQRIPMYPVNWRDFPDLYLLTRIVPKVLPSAREPLLPTQYAASTTDVFPDGFYGLPTPFALTQKPRVLTPDSGHEILNAVSSGVSAHSSPVILAALALLVIIITIISLIWVLGRQRVLGVYKAVGFSGEEIRRVHLIIGTIDAMLGTLAGGAALLYANSRIASNYGFQMHFQWTTVLGWLLFLVLVTWWQAAVVSALYHTAEIRALLLRGANFDWWAMLRFDLSKPR